MAKKRVKKRDKYPTVYSTNFLENINNSNEKCFVPLKEYRDLEKRYFQLFGRYQRIKRL